MMRITILGHRHSVCTHVRSLIVKVRGGGRYRLDEHKINQDVIYNYNIKCDITGARGVLPTPAFPFSHSGFTIWISQTVYFTSEHIRLFTF